MSNLNIDPVPILPTSFVTFVGKRTIGQAVPFSESYVIGNPTPLPAQQPIASVGVIRLRECPRQDTPSSVIIPGYTEVPATPYLSGTQFAVDYSNGIITFNFAQVGNTVTVSYEGTGSVVRAEDINNILAVGFSSLMQRATFTATSNQTVFNLGFPVSTSSTLVYSQGLLMTEGGSADYTITGSSQITFNVGRGLGAVINFIKIGS